MFILTRRPSECFFWLGIYINRVTPNLTKVSVEKIADILLESHIMLTMLRYFNFFSFCHKTGSYFQNIDMIFQESIYDHIKIPYIKFQVSVSFGSVYRLFQNLQRIYRKKLPKCLKIAITRSNLKISKNKKWCL